MEINVIIDNKIEVELSDLKIGDVFFFVFDGMDCPYILIDNTSYCYEVFDLKERQVKKTTRESRVRLYNKAELNLEV